MKNEFLARAISEIDDDLLEEALRPVPRKRKRNRVLSRLTIAAACFVMLVAVALPLSTDEDAVLLINGEKITEGKSIELSLDKSAQKRVVMMPEVPLQFSGNGDEVLVQAERGSFVLDEDGLVTKGFVPSKDAKLTWVLEDFSQSEFELKLVRGDSCFLITAKVDRAGGKVYVERN